MNGSDVPRLFTEFLDDYDVEAKNAIWRSHSQRFNDFWKSRILNAGPGELTDAEIDDIVRILDRQGKGNTGDDEAVARAMIAQGAWRRLFKQMRGDRKLSSALNEVLTSDRDPSALSSAIDRLYTVNKGGRNNLTGQTGSAIGAFLAAHDPFANVSVISLNDRRKVIEYFGLAHEIEFEKDSVGRKIASSNLAIQEGFAKLGVNQNARTISVFLYSAAVRPSWKVERPEEAVSESAALPVAPEASASGDPSVFYMEKQLEDFLIANWDKTELGKDYDLVEEDGELVSQQYRTPIGIIDILVRDKKTKQLVVIELKRNQTSDDTVGQLLRYMGWVEEQKPTGSPAKGIIIAARYDERLRYALKKVKDVEVYQYFVDFNLKEFKPD
jgi:hypothetical protein